MRRVDRQILQVRRQTDNDDSSAGTGITDAEFLQYLNDAQHRLQSLITDTHIKAFATTYDLSLISGTQSYNLQGDTFMDHKVIQVEYSSSSDTEMLFPLMPIHYSQISRRQESWPSGYCINNGKIHFSPVPTGGGLARITYTRKLPELDLRRGTVASAATSGSDYIDIIVENDSTLDATELALVEYVSVVDYDGNPKYEAIPVSSYDAGTRKLTLRAGVATADGTIAAGDYVVSGRYASSHSQLPQFTERYLLAYAAWKIFKRDSSSDSAEQQSELSAMEQEIISSYASIADDSHYFNVIHEEFT